MKPGAVKRFKLPDAMDGIRFVLGRMVKMVQEARKDPLVIATARKIAGLSTAGRNVEGDARTIQQLKGLHAWCRGNFEYVADPVNVEVIQTPNRMLRELDIPEALQKAMWAPIGKVLGGKMPKPRIMGDSDEAVTLVLSLAAAIGIEPLRIQLGGHDNTVHYAWGAARVKDGWKALDILVEDFGTHAPMDEIDHVEIPM